MILTYEQISCCCYHKGTYFQANHNKNTKRVSQVDVVVATTKVRIFKQITTDDNFTIQCNGCCCYHKGTYFQANHNWFFISPISYWLLLLPQRYVFSSKSQRVSSHSLWSTCCCCYHKGTYFQANHNVFYALFILFTVVVATTKVRIFKQITTK